MITCGVRIPPELGQKAHWRHQTLVENSKRNTNKKFRSHIRRKAAKLEKNRHADLMWASLVQRWLFHQSYTWEQSTKLFLPVLTTCLLLNTHQTGSIHSDSRRAHLLTASNEPDAKSTTPEVGRVNRPTMPLPMPLTKPRAPSS